MAARMRPTAPSLVGRLANIWRARGCQASKQTLVGRQKGAESDLKWLTSPLCATTANKRGRLCVCSPGAKDMIQFALPPWCALACERACHLSLSAAFSPASWLACWPSKGCPASCSAEGGAFLQPARLDGERIYASLSTTNPGRVRCNCFVAAKPSEPPTWPSSPAHFRLVLLDSYK